MNRLLSLVLILSLCFASAAQAAHYTADNHVDLATVLAPPPAPDSPAQQQDLNTVLADQASRTPAEASAAEADAQITIYRFADVLGDRFHPGALPKTEAFFQAVGEDSRDIVSAAKDHWGRPRPFVASPEVHPVVQEPGNGSYPSGHATFGYLTAIILADMIPEKADALFARGRQFGENRVIAGVHYPTDVEAGRITASVIANGLLSDAAFQHDFTAAKAELRQALGYPAN
jgi:acid phosphatase (class A)